MNSTPVLEMRNIAKAFGKFYALKGVDLTVYPGEIHALMGENGAGKSTLMKVLAGAYTATSGEILIDSKPFLSHSHAKRCLKRRYYADLSGDAAGTESVGGRKYFSRQRAFPRRAGAA